MIDIGEGKFVKKDVNGTKTLLENQLKKLKKSQEETERKMEDINSNLTITMEEYDQVNKKKNI